MCSAASAYVVRVCVSICVRVSQVTTNSIAGKERTTNVCLLSCVDFIVFSGRDKLFYSLFFFVNKSEMRSRKRKTPKVCALPNKINEKKLMCAQQHTHIHCEDEVPSFARWS